MRAAKSGREASANKCVVAGTTPPGGRSGRCFQRNISTSTPSASFKRSSVLTLRSGRELTLSGNRDVNDSNNGLMVRDGTGKARFLEWEAIREVRFD